MVEFLLQYGLVGLFIAAFVAGTIIPFNSEALLTILVLGGVSFTSCLVVATIGNMLGGVVTFYLGFLGKWEWIERYGKVKRAKVESFMPRLNRYGPVMALLSFVPGIGNLIILGLGFFRLSTTRTLIFMFVGKLARYLLWGYVTLMMV